MNSKKVKNQKFFDFYKIMIPASLTFIGLLIPISLFHELGHIVICGNSGSHYTLGFDGMNFVTHCSPPPEPIWLITSMGGIFGTIGSLTPLAIRRIRNKRGILFGFLTIGFFQAVIAFSETFLNSWYLSSDSKFLLTIISIIFMMIIVLKDVIRKKTTSKTP